MLVSILFGRLWMGALGGDFLLGIVLCNLALLGQVHLVTGNETSSLQ
jgi:hypothetical protein